MSAVNKFEINGQEVQFDDSKLTELEKNLAKSEKEITDDITWNSGNIDFSGAIIENNNYSYSLPILLKKGDKIKISTEGSGFAVLSETDEEGVSRRPIIRDITSGKDVYEYIAASEVYVCVCVRSESPYAVYITHVADAFVKVEELQQRMDSFIDNFDLVEVRMLTDGTLESSGALSVIIPVKEGDILTQSYAMDATGVMRQSYYGFLKDKENLTDGATPNYSDIIYGRQYVQETTDSITIPSDTNYVIITLKIKNDNYWKPKEVSINGVDLYGSIVKSVLDISIQIKEEISRAVEAEMNLAKSEKEITDDITWNSGYNIDFSGAIVENNNYSYSLPILLKKGDKIKVSTEGDGFAVLSETDEEGASRRPIIRDTASGKDVHEYIAASEVYVCVCVRSKSPYAVYIAHVADAFVKVEELQQRMDSFIDNFDLVEVRMLADGTLESSGALSVVIPVKEGDILKQRNSSKGQSYYAFLKDKENLTDGATPNYSDILSGRQFVNSLTTVEVPSDANFVIISLRVNGDDGWKPTEVSINGIDLYRGIAEGILRASNSGNTKQLTMTTIVMDIPIYVPLRNYNDSLDYISEDTESTVRVLLRLPINYNSEKSVPLVFFSQGSGVMGSNEVADFGKRKPFVDYLNKEGFAVFCCACKSKNVNGWNEDFGSPVTNMCYVRAYEYIKKHFRINNVFCIAKSQGGVSAINLSHSRLIPFNATAHLSACAYNSVTTIFGYGYEQQRRSIIEFGFSEEFIALFDQYCSGTTGDNYRAKWSSELNAAFEEEAWKMTGYCCETMGTNLRVGITRDELLNDESFVRRLPTPMLIFIAEGDVNVDNDLIRSYYHSVMRGNGICYLRTIPRDMGNHHAVDSTCKWWYETESEFQKALPSLPDGVYNVGFFNNMKYYNVVAGAATQTDSSADICPKVEEVVTKSGITCYGVTLAWVEAVRFFREFGG